LQEVLKEEYEEKQKELAADKCYDSYEALMVFLTRVLVVLQFKILKLG